jgi:hypothetical protein
MAVLHVGAGRSASILECMRLKLTIAFLGFVLFARPASAQLFEAGFTITSAQWSEFDGTDLGLGGRLTFRPISFIGFDADLAWYLQEFPEAPEFSGSRFEGLFGITLGPQLGGLRPFLKGAYGFLNSSAAPRDIPCITIFPPPLFCVMAAGQTLPAFEFGGGLQFDVSTRGFLRVDIGSRWLQYPAPSFDSEMAIHDRSYWGARSRLSFGGGVKF